MPTHNHDQNRNKKNWNCHNALSSKRNSPFRVPVLVLCRWAGRHIGCCWTSLGTQSDGFGTNSFCSLTPLLTGVYFAPQRGNSGDRGQTDSNGASEYQFEYNLSWNFAVAYSSDCLVVLGLYWSERRMPLSASFPRGGKCDSLKYSSAFCRPCPFLPALKPFQRSQHIGWLCVPAFQSLYRNLGKLQRRVWLSIHGPLTVSKPPFDNNALVTK